MSIDPTEVPGVRTAWGIFHRLRERTSAAGIRTSFRSHAIEGVGRSEQLAAAPGHDRRRFEGCSDSARSSQLPYFGM